MVVTIEAFSSGGWRPAISVVSFHCDRQGCSSIAHKSDSVMFSLLQCGIVNAIRYPDSILSTRVVYDEECRRTASVANCLSP